MEQTRNDLMAAVAADTQQLAAITKDLARAELVQALKPYAIKIACAFVALVFALVGVIDLIRLGVALAVGSTAPDRPWLGWSGFTFIVLAMLTAAGAFLGKRSSPK
jgi:hypothetical protein